MKNKILNFQKIFFLLCLCLFSSNLELASEEQNPKNRINLGFFLPYNSGKDNELEKNLSEKLKLELESKSFSVNFSRNLRNINLKNAKENEDEFYIEGYYKKNPNTKTITLYAQIYNPETGNIIDAVFESNNINDKLGFESEEIKDRKIISEEKTISNFINRIIISIQSNPSRTEIRENINERLLTKQLGKEQEFPISKTTSEKDGKKILRELGELEVVTASRKSQKISDAPSKIIVFTKEQIYNRGYRTLTELLQDVPGFDFNSFNDSGEYPTDLLLRGISDVGQTQILIMENGIIQNDVGNGWLRHVQFESLMIDLERIEIILGPGSSLYGANAYAGLINLITKKGKSFFKNQNSNYSAEARIQVGKYNTYMPEASATIRLPNEMIFQIAGRYYNTTGDRGVGRPDPGNYFKNNYEPDKVQTSEYGVINNDRTPFGTRKYLTDGYNNFNKDFFVRGSLSKDGFTIGFNIWDTKQGLSTYVPSYEYFTNTANIPYQKHHRGYFVYTSYETEITTKLNSVSKVYYRNNTIMPDTGFEYTYRYQSIDFPEGNRTPTFDKLKQYHGPSYLTGIQQQFNYKIIPTNDLIFGLQIDKFVRQSISDNVGGVSLGIKQNTSSNIVGSTWETQRPSVATVFYSNTVSGYIQDEQKFFSDKLSLTIGLRVDNDSDYKRILTRRGGLIFKPIQFYHLKLLYGEAYKAPTVFQLYDEFRGNRELRSQRIKTYEIENSFFNSSKGNLKLGYFISQLDGLIAESRNPDLNAPEGRRNIFQNFKPTHIYGFSVESELNITKEINFFGNYTITRDRDVKTEFQVNPRANGSIDSITQVHDGKEIDNIAERKANIGTNILFFKKLNFNLRMNWVGRRKAPVTNKYFQPYDFDFIRTKYTYQTEGKPDGYMSGYMLLNATITYKDLFSIEGLDLQIIGRNILNKPFLGMGRQSGSAVRPVDSLQPTIRNPDGFVSPYHPQAGREIFLQVVYSF